MSARVFDTQSLLKQALDPKPPVLPPDTPLKVAIAAMSQARASCILIAQQQQPIGIFTERDVVKITASEIPLEGVAISEVMTLNPIAISLAQTVNADRSYIVGGSRSHAAALYPTIGGGG
jgi:CBS domain-containing protein